MPKPTVSHYEECFGRSVVGEFNRAQHEQGKQEVSNGSSHNWLKSHRPKVAICPHLEDYCDAIGLLRMYGSFALGAGIAIIFQMWTNSNLLKAVVSTRDYFS